MGGLFYIGSILVPTLFTLNARQRASVLAQGLLAFSALVVTHDNTVWFVDNGADALVRYQPGVHRYTFYQLALAGGASYGLALDQENRLWFTADTSTTDYVGMMHALGRVMHKCLYIKRLYHIITSSRVYS